MKEHLTGMLLVISGPSGVGKGTMVKRLMDSDPEFRRWLAGEVTFMAIDEAQDVHASRHSACRDVARNVCTDDDASHNINNLQGP